MVDPNQQASKKQTKQKPRDAYEVLHSKIIGSEKKGYNHAMSTILLDGDEIAVIMVHRDHADRYDNFENPTWIDLGRLASQLEKDQNSFIKQAYFGPIKD